MGAQITTIAHSFIRQLQLEIHDLNEMIWVVVTGGFMVPYSGYVEVNLWIPQFPQCGMVLMLVILDSWYTYGIPIQINTWVIQKMMQMVNEQNLNELSEAWRNTYVSTVMAGQLALSESAKNVFDLSTVRWPLTTTMEVILSPFETQTVPGTSKVKSHVKWVHVIVEPREQGFSNEVVTISMYCDLKPDSSRVKICLWNLTLKKIVIPTQCVMRQIKAANEVPDMYAPVTPKGCLDMGATTLKNENQPSSTSTPVVARTSADSQPVLNQRSLPLIELYLTRLTFWGAQLGLQSIVRRLWICYQFVDVFSQHDLDLGETSVVEHKIKLEPSARPFHERYWPIPQSMFEVVCKHFQEMLEIRVIRPSTSPWPLQWSWSKKGMASFGSALICTNWTT